MALVPVIISSIKVKSLHCSIIKDWYFFTIYNFFVKMYIAISGLPHGPYTVKNLSPVVLSPYKCEYELAISSFVFFVAPYSDIGLFVLCFSLNGIFVFPPYTDELDAYILNPQYYYFCKFQLYLRNQLG